MGKLDFLNTRLGLLVLRYLFLSLLIAIAFLIIVFFLSSMIIDKVSGTQLYLDEKMEDFKQYILDYDVATNDISGLDGWHQQNDQMSILIFRNDLLIYSAFNNFGLVDLFASDEFTDVRFADGRANVIMITEYNSKAYWVTFAINCILSFIIFILLFLYFFKNRLMYIEEIKRGLYILEGGYLDYKIPVTGKDELTELTRSINEMSNALRSQIINEEKALKLNGQLITNVSHDIRTPLTAIMGYLDLIKNEKCKDEDEKKRFVQSAALKAEQLKDLTDDLFYYTCLSNPPEDALEPFDAGEFFAHAILESEPMLSHSGFDVQQINDITENIRINVNPGHTNRLFDNLVSNILKYGDRREPVIFQCLIEDDHVCYRVENAINRKLNRNRVDSNGLGLNICQSILKAHGGSLEVESDSEFFKVSACFPIIERHTSKGGGLL